MTGAYGSNGTYGFLDEQNQGMLVAIADGDQFILKTTRVYQDRPTPLSPSQATCLRNWLTEWLDGQQEERS